MNAIFSSGMSSRKNTPLYIGILIPIVMVLFILGSIYIPRIFFANEPQYGFLYSTGREFTITDGERVEFFVTDGHLVKVTEDASSELRAKPVELSQMYDHAPSFSVYDVNEDTSKKVSFEEASTLRLDPSRISPDGFRLEDSANASFFPFDSYGRNEHILIGDHFRRELHLNYDTNDGLYSFKFLGWIVSN